VKSLYGRNPKTCSFALAAGAILVHAVPALANGRFPQSNQIVFSPTNPDLILLRTTYGILPTYDHGATWQFLCEDAIGLGPNAIADPLLGLTHNNSLLAGVSLGLNVSPDTGCNWKCIEGPLAGQPIADLAVQPDSPSSAVAITRSYFAADSGQDETYSQIYGTEDDGMRWTSLGTPIDPTVLVETVDVAKTDRSRLYVSGVRGYGTSRTASLFVSKDKGTTWTEWRLPASQFDPSAEDSLFIGAVDPTNADRLYLRSSALPTGGVSRLTVLTLAANGTPTFVSPRSFDAGMASTGLIGEMLGLAITDDGSTLYIGSVEDGLWRARTSDLAFEKVSSIEVQCLAARGNELWACSAPESGFIAGVSTDGGKTFTSKLPLIGTLSGPIACAPNPAGAACGEQNNASVCSASYQSFCDSYSCREPSGGVDASPGGAKSKSSSCALSVPERGGAAGIGVHARRAMRRAMSVSLRPRMFDPSEMRIDSERL
jgi:Sortilin, neurotensin receptor 3,